MKGEKYCCNISVQDEIKKELKLLKTNNNIFLAWKKVKDNDLKSMFKGVLLEK